MYSSFSRSGNRYTFQTNLSYKPVGLPYKGSTSGTTISFENGRSESDIWLGNCLLTLFSGPSDKRLDILSKLFIKKLNPETSPHANQGYNLFEEVNIASVIPGTALPEPTSLNSLVSRYTWGARYLYRNVAIPYEYCSELVKNRVFHNMLRAVQNVTDTDSASVLMRELIHDVHIEVDLMAEVLAKALVMKGLAHVD